MLIINLKTKFNPLV